MSPTSYQTAPPRGVEVKIAAPAPTTNSVGSASPPLGLGSTGRTARPSLGARQLHRGVGQQGHRVAVPRAKHLRGEQPLERLERGRPADLLVVLAPHRHEPSIEVGGMDRPEREPHLLQADLVADNEPTTA